MSVHNKFSFAEQFAEKIKVRILSALAEKEVVITQIQAILIRIALKDGDLSKAEMIPLYGDYREIDAIARSILVEISKRADPLTTEGKFHFYAIAELNRLKFTKIIFEEAFQQKKTDQDF